MQDRYVEPQIPRQERQLLEASPLHRITDGQLLKAVSCTGFLERFRPETEQLEPEYRPIVNAHTEGYEMVREGHIQDRDGQEYGVRYARDLDNIGLTIHHADGTPIVHLKLRDREFDGTLEATSPHYLQTIGGVAEENIPYRSRFLGGTNWYYSGERDVPPHKSVEFSIVSSDPTKRLDSRLGMKGEALWVPAERLARFIDDPFAFIPFNNPTPSALNEWYTMWWQVANRGLRGKSIPFPGQTSENGFRGFFKHTVAEVSQLIGDLGYTHLSGVPTWQYVWSLNLANGFFPDHSDHHEQALSFFTALDEMQLPHPGRKRRESDRRVGHLDQKDPLRSWLAVLPFAMNAQPDFVPHLAIAPELSQGFDTIYQTMHAHLGQPDGSVRSYPLNPANNLWHSKEV